MQLLRLVCLENEISAFLVRQSGVDRVSIEGEPSIGLYFYLSEGSLQWGEFARQRFEAGDPTAIGEYWTRIADPTNNFERYGAWYPHVELMAQPLKSLRDSVRSTRAAESDLEVELLFASGIPGDARNVFEGLLSRSGFSVTESRDFEAAFLQGLVTTGKAASVDRALLLDCAFGDLHCVIAEGDRLVARAGLPGLGSDPRVAVLADLLVRKAAHAMGALYLYTQEDQRRLEVARMFPLARRVLPSFVGPSLRVDVELSTMSRVQVLVSREELDERIEPWTLRLKQQVQRFVDQNDTVKRAFVLSRAVWSDELSSFLQMSLGVEQVKLVDDAVEFTGRLPATRLQTMPGAGLVEPAARDSVAAAEHVSSVAGIPSDGPVQSDSGSRSEPVAAPFELIRASRGSEAELSSVTHASTTPETHSGPPSPSAHVESVHAPKRRPGWVRVAIIAAVVLVVGDIARVGLGSLGSPAAGSPEVVESAAVESEPAAPEPAVSRTQPASASRTAIPIRSGGSYRGTLGNGVVERVYRLVGEPDSEVRVNLSSMDFDPLLSVGSIVRGTEMVVALEDNNGGGGTDSELTFKIGNTGEVGLRVRSYSVPGGGAYTLSISELAPTQRVATANFRGALSASDRTRENGSYVDTYQVRTSPDARVVVSVTSDAFDPYLSVARPEQPSEVFGDDDSGDGWNSRLEITVGRSGELAIQVTSYRAEKVGAYELAVEGFDTGSVDILEVDDRPATADRAETVDRPEAAERSATAARTGRLAVSIRNGWALVSINGGEPLETPFDIELPPGRYDLRIYRPGYREIQRSVTINPGSLIERVYDLVRGG